MEILNPKKVPIQIVDRTYTIGALSYKMLQYDLPDYFSKIHPVLFDVKEWGKNVFEDIKIILNRLSEEYIVELMSILLKEKDTKFIKENVLSDLNIIIRILTITYESNKELFGNFMKATEKLKLLIKTEKKIQE